MFETSARRAYVEARVALRAARGAGSPERFLDLVLLAEAHRSFGRRERVRVAACKAWLAGRTTGEQEVAWMTYVDMMVGLYCPHLEDDDDGR